MWSFGPLLRHLPVCWAGVVLADFLDIMGPDYPNALPQKASRLKVHGFRCQEMTHAASACAVHIPMPAGSLCLQNFKVSKANLANL